MKHITVYFQYLSVYYMRKCNIFFLYTGINSLHAVNIHLINCLLLLSWVGSDNLSILICKADDLMNDLPNQNNEETFGEFD